MTPHDGGRFLRAVDVLARGNGWAMGQMKVTRADGSVTYHFSAPQFHPLNLKGWLWYWAHKRDITKRRAIP